MTKEKMIVWVKENYCDIEAYPIPKRVGNPLPPERLLNEIQRKKLLEKALLRFGYKFEFFLLLWLKDHDNWDGMYNHWLGFEKDWDEEGDISYRMYKSEEEYTPSDEQ